MLFQYGIQENGIEPRTDGTGMVNNDLFCQYSEDGGETWQDIYHRIVVTPGDEAQVIIAVGTGVKAAYKELLRVNWGTAPVQEPPPILTSGDPADLLDYVVALKAWQAAREAANLAAQDAADAVNGFIPSWPVTFEV